MAFNEYTKFVEAYNRRTHPKVALTRKALNAGTFGFGVIYGMATQVGTGGGFVQSPDGVHTAVNALAAATVAGRVGLATIRGANIASAYHTKSQLQPDTLTFKRNTLTPDPSALEIITVTSDLEDTRLMKQTAGAAAGATGGAIVSSGYLGTGVIIGTILGAIYNTIAR